MKLNYPKGIIATKEDLEQFATKEDYNTLQTSVDNIAKKVKDYHQETVSLRQSFNRLQGWVSKRMPA